MSNDIIVIPAGALQNDDGFDAEGLIQQFLNDTQGLMEGSKKRYRKSLKKYFQWLSLSSFDPARITLTELLVYRKHLEECDSEKGGNLSKFTVGIYLTLVKLFYEWAHAKGMYPINPGKGLKNPKKVSKFKRQPLSNEQAIQLLEYFSDKSIRDFAIINTLLRCGLRVMELCRLDIGDIVITGGVRVINVQGKGKDEKDRDVPLTDKALESIKKYLESRSDKETLTKASPIFVSESVVKPGTRLVPDTISRIAKIGLKAIGLDDECYTAHSLRHTSGSAILRAGGTLEQAQVHLRHASPLTTGIYVAQIKADKDRENSGTKLIDELF